MKEVKTEKSTGKDLLMGYPYVVRKGTPGEDEEWPQDVLAPIGFGCWEQKINETKGIKYGLV